LIRFATRFLHDERGATAIEYSMILAGIFLVILGAYQLVASKATTRFNEAAAAIVAAI